MPLWPSCARQSQGILGTVFCFVTFCWPFAPHCVPTSCSVGNRRSRIWKDREDILLVRNWHNLIFLLHQYAWPISWRWDFTSWLLLGSVNSRFLDFTEQFMGCERRGWGICCHGLHWAMNHHLGIPFLLSPCESCKWALRPPGGDGKGLLGASHERAQALWGDL